MKSEKRLLTGDALPLTYLGRYSKYSKLPMMTS